MKKTLSDALALYTRESERLENAYASLQQEFASLKEELLASAQTLESIVAHLSEGLLFVDHTGKITLFNPAAQKITGEKEVKGSSFWDHFSDGLFGFSMRKALVESIKSQRILLTLEDASASKEVEVSVEPVEGKGVLIVLADRTEMRELEKVAQRGDRLKELGEMAARLAHEIRNPLGGIEGFAALLESDLKDSPEKQEMAHQIVDGTRTLNRLVTNVLDYARPYTLHFETVDLAGVIEEVIALSGREIAFNAASAECLVAADRDALKMALLNLVRNALEASPKRVEITLTHDGEVRVTDWGEGISKENREKIFTPFFTTKNSGSGLGLSEVQKIVDAHGGTLVVESGETTTFKVKLCPLKKS